MISVMKPDEEKIQITNALQLLYTIFNTPNKFHGQQTKNLQARQKLSRRIKRLKKCQHGAYMITALPNLPTLPKTF